MDLDRLLKRWNSGRRDPETCEQILDLLEEEVGVKLSDYDDLSGLKNCFDRVNELHRRGLCNDSEAAWRYILLSRFLGHSSRHTDRIVFLEWLLGIQEDDYDDEQVLRDYLDMLSETWLREFRLELICHLAESRRVFGQLEHWAQLISATGGWAISRTAWDDEDELEDDQLLDRLWATTRQADFEQAFQFLMEWSDVLRFRGQFSTAARLIVAFFEFESQDFENDDALDTQLTFIRQELGRETDFLVTEWADSLKMLGRWDDASLLTTRFAELRPQLFDDYESGSYSDRDYDYGLSWKPDSEDDDYDDDDDRGYLGYSFDD